MKSFLFKIKTYIAAHKGMSIAVAIVLIGVLYYGHSLVSAKSTSVRYVLGTVSDGTFINSVSGAGQIAAGDQVDLKPDVSGTVLSVDVAQGDTVKEGQVIATIDPGSAALDVRNAQLSLQSSQLALDQLENPIGTNLTSAQDALTSAQESETTTKNNITKAYNDGFSDAGTAVEDLTEAVNDMNNIFYNSNHSPYMSDTALGAAAGENALESKDNAGVEFDSAKKEVEDLVASYGGVTRQSDHQTIENIVNQAYTAAQSLSDAAKSLKTTLDQIEADENSVPAQLPGDETTVSNDLSKVNGDVSSLFSVQNTLSTSQQSLDDAERTVEEKQTALGNITDPDETSLDAAELDVQTKEAALIDAEQKLADYTVKAPFDGVVAELDVKKGDTVSNSAVATVITNQQVATVSLNELDAAKVKTGDKAELTFDAVSDLTITGTVTSIDTIGTVSQGVVTYNATISLDTTDDRIKPGMSVTANIITDSKPNVILVPSSAVQTSGGQSFVEELSGVSATGTAAQAGVESATPPTKVSVTVGDSNDTQTEILSGLTAGDAIVVRTVSVSADSTTANTTARSGTAAGGNTFFGGGGASFGGGFSGAARAGGSIRTVTR